MTGKKVELRLEVFDCGWGQRLKNKDCRLLRELKALNAGNRLLLSGTPLPTI